MFRFENSLINDFNNFRQDTKFCFYEEENNVVVKMLAPGFDKSDITINLTSNILEIKSNKDDLTKKSLITPIREKFKIYKEVEPDMTSAKLDKGVLEIKMPIKQKFHKKEINIL